jgi:hypothetical protein
VPLIGSHATVADGLGTGALAYAAEVGAEVTGAGQIGTGPFREPLAALPGVPFVAPTPGGKAGRARDIATLKGLRAP